MLVFAGYGVPDQAPPWLHSRCRTHRGRVGDCNRVSDPAGQMCSDTRQEFILLSDVLGVSMLVDAINHRRPTGATENTVFGPFHVDGSPERQMGDNKSRWQGEL